MRTPLLPGLITAVIAFGSAPAVDAETTFYGTLRRTLDYTDPNPDWEIVHEERGVSLSDEPLSGTALDQFNYSDSSLFAAASYFSLADLRFSYPAIDDRFDLQAQTDLVLSADGTFPAGHRASGYLGFADAYQKIVGVHGSLATIRMHVQVSFSGTFERTPTDLPSLARYRVGVGLVDPVTLDPVGSHVFFECEREGGEPSPSCDGTGVSFTVSDESSGDTSARRMEGTASGEIDLAAVTMPISLSTRGSRLWIGFDVEADIDHGSPTVFARLRHDFSDTVTVTLTPATPGAQLAILAPEPTASAAALCAALSTAWLARRRSALPNRRAMSQRSNCSRCARRVQLTEKASRFSG